jgi:hypothetical protein
MVDGKVWPPEKETTPIKKQVCTHQVSFILPVNPANSGNTGKSDNTLTYYRGSMQVLPRAQVLGGWCGACEA